MSTRQISLAIRGMSCASCAVDIERTLVQLDGVIAAQVNYATERASVVFDPARVFPSHIVGAIRGRSFETPLDHRTIYSDDLLYATSARTIEQVVKSADGVVDVSVDLGARRVEVDLLPGFHASRAPADALQSLGLHVGGATLGNAPAVFALRVAVVTLIWVLTLWSAGSHAGWLTAPGSLHAPLVVSVLALVLLLSAGLPFFHSAFDALLQGEFDASALTALVASTVAIGSFPLAILIPSTAATDLGFVLAATLTAGWFLTRACALWVLPRLRQGMRTMLDCSACPRPTLRRDQQQAHRAEVK